jgi:hypothetical protein
MKRSPLHIVVKSADSSLGFRPPAPKGRGSEDSTFFEKSSGRMPLVPLRARNGRRILAQGEGAIHCRLSNEAFRCSFHVGRHEACVFGLDPLWPPPPGPLPQPPKWLGERVKIRGNADPGRPQRLLPLAAPWPKGHHPDGALEGRSGLLPLQECPNSRSGANGPGLEFRHL